MAALWTRSGAAPFAEAGGGLEEVGRWPAKGRKGAGSGSSSCSFASSRPSTEGARTEPGGVDVTLALSMGAVTLTGRPKLTELALAVRSPAVDAPPAPTDGARNGMPSRRDPSLMPLAVESLLADSAMGLLVAAAAGRTVPMLLLGLRVCDGDQADMVPVRGRTCDPVSNASDERADCGTSNDAPEAVLGRRGLLPPALAPGEFGFVKVTVWPCRNWTEPSSDTSDDVVHREVSVTDDPGRDGASSPAPAPWTVSCESSLECRTDARFESSNGLTLSAGLVGLVDAALPCPAPAPAPAAAPILTRPAWPFCSSTRRTPCADTGVMICGGSRMYDMVDVAERVVMVERCDWAERDRGSPRTDMPRPLAPGEVERKDRLGDEPGLPLEGGSGGKTPPELGRVGETGEPASGEDTFGVLGSLRSSPGERGGRIGAPLASVPCGTAGVSGVRTGGSGLSSMISAPASASESRLAMLVGMDARSAWLRGGKAPLSRSEGDSPNAPRWPSAIDMDDEWGGM